MTKLEEIKSIILKILIAFNVLLHILHLIIIFTSKRGLAPVVFPIYNAMVYLPIFIVLLIYNKWSMRRVLFVFFFPVYALMLSIVSYTSFYFILGPIMSIYIVVLDFLLLFEWNIKEIKIDFPIRPTAIIFLIICICFIQLYVRLGTFYTIYDSLAKFLDVLSRCVFIAALIAYIVLMIIYKVTIVRTAKILETLKRMEERKQALETVSENLEEKDDIIAN